MSGQSGQWMGPYVPRSNLEASLTQHVCLLTDLQGRVEALAIEVEKYAVGRSDRFGVD